MIASFAVLGLVVDDAVDDFDLTGRVVALEVRCIVLRVPETELDGPNSEIRAGARSLVPRRQTSSVSPSGTK